MKKFDTLVNEALKLPNMLKSKKRIGTEREAIQELKNVLIYFDIFAKEQYDYEKETTHPGDFFEMPSFKKNHKLLGLKSKDVKEFLLMLKIFVADADNEDVNYELDPNLASDLHKLTKKMLRDLKN